MIENFPFYLALIMTIVLLIMLADKIKVAYPVILVVAGLLISFIPGVPVLHIKPELIFIIDGADRADLLFFLVIASSSFARIFQ